MSLLQTSSPDYFVVSQQNGLSQFQTMTACLGGSAFQTVLDNPVTAYRQLVQQFAKDAAGKAVDPRVGLQKCLALRCMRTVLASWTCLSWRMATRLM